MEYLIPGEIITEDGDIELNSGKNAKTLTVSNTGDLIQGLVCHWKADERASVMQRHLKP